MATTSSTLATGKAPSAGHAGSGKGRKRRAAMAIATAALGLSLVTGGLLWQGRELNLLREQNTQHETIPANVAQTQTRAGGGYLEFAPGDVSGVSAAIPASNVARTRTEAGAGYLEFQPGEGPIVGTGASRPAAGVGLREHLDGEGPVAALLLSVPGNQPAPDFGPQP